MRRIISFWWVDDGQLRESLEKDYEEVEKCSSNDIDKATMVLCGSVVEGLLFHATKQWRSGRTDLKDAIELARIHDRISNDTAQVCNVIRDWRNLIHPERQAKLGIPPEDLTQKAKAAKAVLETVVLDLEKSYDQVFIDGKYGVPRDWQEPQNDKWLSWDSRVKFDGKDTLRVEGKGKEDRPNGVTNAWMRWKTPAVRRKQFFKAQVFLQPDTAPDEILFQFHQSAPEEATELWTHRVYWGRDLAFDPEYARRRVGNLPTPGEWKELTVDLKRHALLDLEQGIDGVAIVLASDPITKPRTAWLGRSVFTSVA